MNEERNLEDIGSDLAARSYEPIQTIGRGAFGEVIIARAKKIEKIYAIKIIKKDRIQQEPYLKKYIDQEINIMKKLKHPNIVEQIEAFGTKKCICIVLEYCKQGNLEGYQASLPTRTFELKQAVEILVDIMKGLRCIHEMKFIHRDIKPENILISRNKDGKYVYKIGDFGFARSILDSEASTPCGTKKFKAPEIHENAEYGISVDIWALGIVFYFMIFAEYPFQGHDIVSDIKQKCNPFRVRAVLRNKQRIPGITEDVDEFFRQVFVVNPKQRITFSKIMQLKLFKDFRSKEMEETNQIYTSIEASEILIKDNFKQQSQEEPEELHEALTSQLFDIDSGSSHLKRELLQINCEIERIIYLKECANELFEHYEMYLTYPERLAAKYSLLKAEIFFMTPLLQNLQAGKMSEELKEANIEQSKWIECTKTLEYLQQVSFLKRQFDLAYIHFTETYYEIGSLSEKIPINNFQNGYKETIEEKTFAELKQTYRQTTIYLYTNLRSNNQINRLKKNKIMMRLLCCHLINSIFSRSKVKKYLPCYYQWLESNKIIFSHIFDFESFKRWIHAETENNLDKTITDLIKRFF